MRYFIRASLVHEEEDAKIFEYYVKRAFCIVSPSDGHLVIGESQGVSDTATFGKCCCKGKLSAEFTLPKTGYLPGEDVVGNLRIGNKHPKGILQQVHNAVDLSFIRYSVDRGPICGQSQKDRGSRSVRCLALEDSLVQKTRR